jgi:hypothetical protein
MMFGDYEQPRVLQSGDEHVAHLIGSFAPPSWSTWIRHTWASGIPGG